MTPLYKSPLHQTVATTATEFWNDSCSLAELAYAIEHGAVGATTNPTIVLGVLKKEAPLWRGRLSGFIADHPTWTEDQVAWALIEAMAVQGAELLRPIFEREGGRAGRLSIQTNPTLYRDAAALTEQARHFHTLASNLQVKIPVTAAGVRAIEEATCHGVNINATVSFSVPQVIAVAEAVERGLRRRAAAGLATAGLTPVATMMIGRLDDWLHVVEQRDQIAVAPGVADWAGLACFKEAYRLFQTRGYRTRLLAAAYRHERHWSELIGGDVVLTIPHEWQVRFNASEVEVKERIHDPVPPAVLDALGAHFPDFRRAYAETGLTVDEFDSFGPTVRTLRTFIASYRDLTAVIRDVMLPNPDGP
ncbi:MAG: transaldolase family protein [Anaerolineales bacterium]|nr:transaldolase family protein [Anaerolineales bacterium]